MNPNFKDLVSFVPSSQLLYGKNIGTQWSVGLSKDNKWTKGFYPVTVSQGATWQVGAMLY